MSFVLHQDISPRQVYLPLGDWIVFIFIFFESSTRKVIPKRTFITQVLVENKNSWSVKFDGVGIFSSPRVTDLNGDGIGDVVFGVGREEFKRCDSAVIALDGSNGKMLWRTPAIDRLFTSAMFKDLNGDLVDDVFMAGRSAELLAINGKNGKIIWRFDKKQGGIKWYNFYNGQFVKDQDRDGFDDILISNGGNVLAGPFEEKDRHPGNLAVISS